MRKMLGCFVVAILAISVRGLSQSEIRKQLMGSWYSVNRPDTLTLRFTNDSTIYFKMKTAAPFAGTPFSYFIYKIDNQLMMELTPPGSNTPMKLLLWVLSPNEIKLQGVDIQDYDNPLLNVPKETDKNTFRLKRSK